MGYTVACLLVFAAALAGGGLSQLAQARVGLHHRKAHQEYGTVVFLQLGVVFAVLLAFVFDSCWEGYNAAGQAIDLECGALHGASMIAATLPPPQARGVLGLESAYVRSVIGPEWREMRRHRREDLATDDALAALIESAARPLPQEPGLHEDRAAILSLLAAAHAQREVRIFQADQGVPLALWVVLVAFTAVLVAFVSMSALESRAIALAFTATFAAATTSILVLAHLLDYPFEGALRLSPDDYRDLLGKIDALLRAVPRAG